MPRKLLLIFFAVTALARAADSAPAAASSASTATTPAAPASNLIRIAGSDLLQTAIGEPLTQFLKDSHQNAIVDLAGSTPALEALKSGKVQLAIVAVPPGQAPAPKGFTAVPFCFAVDYVIVHPTNPLTGINLRDLAGIYGDNKVLVNSWGQLQLSGNWAQLPLVAYTTSPDDGDVIEILKFIALGQKPVRANVHELNTAEEVVKTVVSDPSAIGVIGYDPGTTAKVLLISQEKFVGGNSPPARPTPEAVFSGEYPLRLPFYLVFNSADKDRVFFLVRLLLNDAYTQRLRDFHFLPLPDTERSSALLQ